MRRELENKRATVELIESLKNFDDSEIRIYTRFAADWRDQRIAEGSPAEVAFWNAVVTLCVEERQRRKAEIHRLEAMYQTGRDPETSPYDSPESPT